MVKKAQRDAELVLLHAGELGDTPMNRAMVLTYMRQEVDILDAVQDPFDIAVDCTSALDLWEEDWSDGTRTVVPQYVQEMALDFVEGRLE